MHQFRLADPDLAALGAGRPSPATLALLRRAQLSRHLLLLREIRLSVIKNPIWYDNVHAMPVPESRALIADPMTGLWAAHALTTLRPSPAPPEQKPTPGESSQPTGRKAAPGEPSEPAEQATAIGELPEAAGREAAGREATGRDAVGQDAAGRDATGRETAIGELPEPVGHVLSVTHGGRTLTVRLDDRGPLRHLLGLTPTEPLTLAEVAQWRESLDEAWRILVTRHPTAAAVVEGVLRVVVPARPDPRAEGVSATSAVAFGAIAMSAPADGPGLAVALLHENQHSVLNAVNGLFELVEPGNQRGYSPWREDPRPTLGILHGVYAFLAVTRFWRAELHARAAAKKRDTETAGPSAEAQSAEAQSAEAQSAEAGGAGASDAGADGADEAEFEFARWRAAVYETTGQLLDGGELTAAGTRLAGALRDEVAPWLDEAVDPEVERLADLARADHYACWRLRNLTLAPDDVDALARAWRAGRDAPAVRSAVTDSERVVESSPRLRMIRALLRGDPVGDARATGGDANGDAGADAGGGAGAGENAGAGGSAGDVAAVRGDVGGALTAYQISLERDRDQEPAWSGLALVSPHQALRRRPEVVRAAALALPEADIADLAAWLS